MSILLSGNEQKYYKQIQESMLEGVRSFLKYQIVIYVVATVLFYEALSFKEHVSFGLAFSLASLIGRNKNIFLEPGVKKSHWFMFGPLAYVFSFWCAYAYIALLSSVDNFYMVLIFFGFLIACLISFLGFIKKLFLYVIFLETLCMFLVNAWVLDNNHEYIKTIFKIFVLLLAMLFVQNQRLIGILKIREQSVSLLSELTLKNEQLEEANLTQSRYLSAASHDLRQPLHAISLITSEVQRKNKNSRLNSAIYRLDQTIEVLSQSFDAMLHLSRFDAGIVPPIISSVCLNTLFSRLNYEMEPIVQRLGIKLHFVPSKVWVKSDEGLLYIVLKNLIRNALRYTKKGGIAVGVRIVPTGVKVMVYDTGVGITETVARKIIGSQPYFNQQEQKVISGVGLGLSISERIARLLDTHLVARSVLHQGTTFGIYLERSQPEVLTVTADEVNPFQDYLFNKKVVILDDDAMVVDGLEYLLSSWGMEVSVALSCEMLEETFSTEGFFDLVISDYHLGLEHENGLDVLHLAKQLHPENPPLCVLITGDTTQDLVNLSAIQGFSIFYKPIRPARLRSQLNNLFQQNKLGGKYDDLIQNVA